MGVNKIKFRKKGALLIAIIMVASSLVGFAFAAPKGGPFQDIWDAIFGVQEDLYSLQSQVDALQANTMVGLSRPDYDSGWVTAGLGYEDIILAHNLETRDLYVYIYYRMSDPTIPSPDYTITHNIRAYEVRWAAYNYNEIEIGFPNPDYVWQEIRVLIWAIPD